MNLGTVPCPKCRYELSGVGIPEAGVLGSCPACATPIACRIFPAAHVPVAHGHTGQAMVDADGASCFFHPGKQAEVPCSHCGRYLCGLCDFESAGKHFCGSCITQQDLSPRAGQKRVFLWTNIALSIAVVSLVPGFCYALPISAPLAIGLAVYGLVRPSGFWHEPGAGWAAIILSGLELAALAAMVAAIFMAD